MTQENKCHIVTMKQNKKRSHDKNNPKGLVKGWGGCCATNTFLKLVLYFKAKEKVFYICVFYLNVCQEINNSTVKSNIKQT